MPPAIKQQRPAHSHQRETFEAGNRRREVRQHDGDYHQGAKEASFSGNGKSHDLVGKTQETGQAANTRHHQEQALKSEDTSPAVQAAIHPRLARLDEQSHRQEEENQCIAVNNPASFHKLQYNMR